MDKISLVKHPTALMMIRHHVQFSVQLNAPQSHSITLSPTKPSILRRAQERNGPQERIAGPLVSLLDIVITAKELGRQISGRKLRIITA